MTWAVQDKYGVTLLGHPDRVAALVTDFAMAASGLPHPELLSAAQKALAVMTEARRLLRAAGFTMEGGTISGPYAEAIEALRAAVAKATKA